MFNWLRELLDIRYDYALKKQNLRAGNVEVVKEEKICESCRTLRLQLAQANDREQYLLHRFLEPTPQQEKTSEEVVRKPVGKPLMLASTRRALLEQQSKMEARALAENKVPKQTTEELEAQITNANNG